MISELRRRTRTARFEKFGRYLDGVRNITGQDDVKIIDIGGTIEFWQRWWSLAADAGLSVTLINNHEVNRTFAGIESDVEHIRNINKDANTLTPSDFDDYDIIFSNSFLEHLRSRDLQLALAEKVVASRKPYFIQVPNKHSPVDPHHPMAPFFALYPRRLRIELVQRFSFGVSPRARDARGAEVWQTHYNPIGKSDLQKLFPDGAIETEHTLGIPLSLLVKKKIRA